MRIAIVSDFFLDYVGGAQSSIHEQTAALTAAGHTVLLVSCDRTARGDRFQVTDAGVRVRPLVTVPGVILPVVATRPALIGQLVDYFRTAQVDVVHLQTEFGLAHAALLAARQLDIPVVHTVHTFYWQSADWWTTPLTPLVRLGLKWVTRVGIPHKEFGGRPTETVLRNLTLAVARLADRVVSPSSHQADDLSAAGVTGTIEVVPNPIARAARPALPLRDATSRPRVLWVARCEPEKRPLVFARAVLDALRQTGNAFDVDFVGDGRELAALRALTADHPSIRVHGMLDHNAVLDLIDASSIVALTSLGFDNQPMTIAEAVSRYRGVLYCDPQLSEGLRLAGYRSVTPDAAGLTAALVDLVRSPAKLIALSDGARTDGALFSADTYVARIVDVYTNALHHVV
jgi:glycosyltransferase involved in cell wall biosynthesis